MNREDIIEALLKDKRADFQTRHEAESALNSILKGIARGLKRDKKVVLSGFGCFRTVRRKTRNGINPATGETLRIKASTTVKFRAGATLKKGL